MSPSTKLIIITMFALLSCMIIAIPIDPPVLRFIHLRNLQPSKALENVTAAPTFWVCAAQHQYCGKEGIAFATDRDGVFAFAGVLFQGEPDGVEGMRGVSRGNFTVEYAGTGFNPASDAELPATHFCYLEGKLEGPGDLVFDFKHDLSYLWPCHHHRGVRVVCGEEGETQGNVLATCRHEAWCTCEAEAAGVDQQYCPRPALP